jgi:CRISPR/Cas system-associated exonuclease Cas4 (RecB family)
MLDFNHRPTIAEEINAFIDIGLQEKRAAQVEREYLGASRLGVSCGRALQYEYTKASKDEDFKGQILRIFEIGHVFETLALDWLRQAGFDIFTKKQNGEAFGFSVAGGRIRGHVDGIIHAAPAELGIRFPAIWECKSMNAKSWRDTVKHGLKKSKPIYAVQVATYQAYMEGTVLGISANPALFTAINKDTAEIYHELVPFDASLAQEASDRAVNLIRATEIGEILPRIAMSDDHFECVFCPYRQRCWKVAA